MKTLIKFLLLIAAAFLLISCGMVNHWESSHYHFYYHTKAIFVIKEKKTFIYCQSPAGVKFYRIRNLYGTFHEGDTILLRDPENYWIYGYTKFIKKIPE